MKLLDNLSFGRKILISAIAALAVIGSGTGIVFATVRHDSSFDTVVSTSPSLQEPVNSSSENTETTYTAPDVTKNPDTDVAIKPADGTSPAVQPRDNKALAPASQGLNRFGQPEYDAAAERNEIIRTDNTASLVAVNAGLAPSDFCIEDREYFNSATANFTMSNGYGGMIVTYHFESNDGSIMDTGIPIQNRVYTYVTYRVAPYADPSAQASYSVRPSTNDWYYPMATYGSTRYRVHVTSPVDMVSQWYNAPRHTSNYCIG